MKLLTSTPVITLIIIAIAVVIIFAIYNRISKNYYFVCPHCGNKFKASTKKLMLTPHVMDEINLKCPKCGKKNYMKMIKGKLNE